MIYYFLIGYLVHFYYFYIKNGGQLRKDLGKYTFIQIFTGFVLTIILWPITIYNQEFLEK